MSFKENHQNPAWLPSWTAWYRKEGERQFPDNVRSIRGSVILGGAANLAKLWFEEIPCHPITGAVWIPPGDQGPAKVVDPEQWTIEFEFI